MASVERASTPLVPPKPPEPVLVEPGGNEAEQDERPSDPALDAAMAPSLPDRPRPRELETGPATLYWIGTFGARRTECQRVKVRRAPYAQYGDAVHVEYVEKGKRKPVGQVQSHDPSLVILVGHGHPDPRSALVDKGDGSSMTRHSCFSPEWKREFSELIEPYVAAHPGVLLADYRGHQTGG